MSTYFIFSVEKHRILIKSFICYSKTVNIPGAYMVTTAKTAFKQHIRMKQRQTLLRISMEHSHYD